MSLVAKPNGLCLEPDDDDLPQFKPRRRGQSVQAENPGVWGLTKKYQQAWNSKSAEDLAALFDEKGDIIHKYQADEARNLKTYKELPENFKINETGGDGDESDSSDGIAFQDEVANIEDI